MKIIRELANHSVKKNKKDTLATKLSIFVAVILLGTVIFTIYMVKTDEIRDIKSRGGDFHVNILDVDEEFYDYFENSEDIEKIVFSKDSFVTKEFALMEKSKEFWDLKGFKIDKGSIPENENEIIVPKRLVERDKNYDIGLNIILNNREYKIVGIYDDHGFSYEDFLLFTFLEDYSKEYIFSGDGMVESFLWYKNPRDTYTLTRQMFSDLKIDLESKEEKDRVYYNTDILESKLIYPKGIIPPEKVIKKTLSSLIIPFILVILFAVMIYGAFNVWNDRDLREISLYKSVGMTDKQVKKLVKQKVFKLAGLPIIIGTGVSYIIANLLFYLMWLNNARTYKEISNIFGMDIPTYEFHRVKISPIPIIFIILFSLLTVYLSAVIPAKKSAKFPIVEGLNGIKKKNIKYGKSSLKGKIEKSLAKDYYKAYSSTYKTIIIAMTLSAMAMSLVVVSQGYRTLNQKYDDFEDIYDVSGEIYSDRSLDENLISEVSQMKKSEEIHIYQRKDLKFLLEDNKEFITEEFSEALNQGKKDSDNLALQFFGLTHKDFEKVIEENNLKSDSKFILLNKTPDSNSTPYKFREYIPIINENIGNLSVKGVKNNIIIDDYIYDLPFTLEAHNKNKIYVFTTMENLEKLNLKGRDKSFIIKLKAKEDINETGDELGEILSKYILESDYRIDSKLLSTAYSEEQLKNENLLNLGFQIVLIIIVLSNAYNSFHGNLRARKGEIGLLNTLGMTKDQIRKMIFNEVKILLKNIFISFIFIFILAVVLRSYRSNYDFVFAIKSILLYVNYIPIIVIFLVVVCGILLSLRRSIEEITGDNDRYIKTIY